MHKLRHAGDDWGMTMQQTLDPRFEFDRHDRLRRALRVSKVGVGEMAEHLEVDRTTISNWINGRAWPRDRDLKRFALRTGYPYTWLKDGEVGPGGFEPPTSTVKGGRFATVTAFPTSKAA